MDHRDEILLDNVFYRTVLDKLYDGVYYVGLDRTILFWNEAAERLTGYSRSEMIGRRCWDNILMDVDENGANLCLRGCPLEKAISEGIMVEGEVYMHHKEGHRVPVLVRVTPIRDAKGVTVGAVEIFSDNSPRVHLAERIEALEKLALLDPLTKIGNRRYGELNLTAKLNELGRYGWPFGILFMDIDHFKAINDYFGHNVGDRILRMVAATLANGLRSSDVISRWGGEEFVAFIPNVDDKQLFYVANKLRLLVENSSIIMEERNVHVTISVAATIALSDETPETLLKRVDTLMGHSKEEGCNRVSM